MKIKKIVYAFSLTAVAILAVCAAPYPTHAANDCPDINTAAPRLSASCDAFYSSCMAAYTNGRSYCASISTAYVLDREKYDVCRGTQTPNPGYDCTGYNVDQARSQLRNDYAVLAPLDQTIHVEAPPTTPPAQPGGSRSSSSGGGSAQPLNGNLGYVPLEPIGFDLSGIQNTNQNAFGEWLSFLLKIAISVGGLVAVVMLVFGGVVYMVSEVVDKKHEALERIQASFLGLFILIASWLILNTINPQLVTGTNFFRITPTSVSGNIPPGNPSTPATQQSIQTAINECLARSSSRTCVYVHDPSGPQCRC